MSELRPRQIAWQIIANEPDPARRMAEADKYPGPVTSHVRVWNNHEDMKLAQIRNRLDALNDRATRHPSPAERDAAARELEAMRYQCRGWILDRVEAMPCGR